jgi:hypothetical protein
MAVTLKTTDAYVVANVKHYELCLLNKELS